jgi:mono/diheme cytochrome c family protein
VVFLVIQLIPYGRGSHSNPAATRPFSWTDPAAEAIARGSCYDCHSNETEWWWATNIAPFSWLVQRDVDEGRARLNFSEFDGLPSAREFQEVVDAGEMPPLQYTLIHPGAKLSDGERQTLVAGYTAGLAASGASGDGGEESTPAPSPTATATGDAVAIIERQCAGCHSADQALGFTAGSAGEAQALIDAMVQRGARLTAAEEQTLVGYFTR